MASRMNEASAALDLFFAGPCDCNLSPRDRDKADARHEAELRDAHMARIEREEREKARRLITVKMREAYRPG